MSECCNPVTPPSCINRCQQLIDACCVIDEQPLPCIMGEVLTEVTSATIGQFTIVVDSATGITVGLAAFGDAIGANAIVTAVNGTLITLSAANIKDVPGASTDPGVSFTSIDNPQCDINKAIHDIICQLQEGGIPCPTWRSVTLNDPIMNLTWTATSKTEYSDPLQCVVRLRGTLQTSLTLPIAQSAINSQLFQIPAGASRPAITKILHTVVVVNSDSQFTALYVPALVVVTTSGTVQVAFTNFNPNVPRNSTCADCGGGDAVATPEAYFAPDATELVFSVPLDGLTYETQP